MLQGAIQRDVYKIFTPIDGVTATTTSEEISLIGVKKASLMLTRANHSAGSTTWTVEVSLDGVVFEPFNKLITNATNTNAQTHVRVASLVQSANGVDLVMLDLEHAALHSMKITATEGTDGTHRAVVMLKS